MGRVRHQIYSNSREAKCGTWPEKGLNITRHCVNGYSKTATPGKSVTHVSFGWCISGRKVQEVDMEDDPSPEWQIACISPSEQSEPT
jgi:hypothetical protein